MGLIIDYFALNKNVRVKNIKNDVNIFFGKNGFYRKVGTKSFKDKHSTTIKYREFTSKRCDDEIGEYILEEVLFNRGFSLSEEAIKNLLSDCIFELFENAYFHGDAHSIYTCGQFFPFKKKLIFSIVDFGKTIPDNVLRKISLNEDSECIEWALGYQNSTKVLVNGYPGGSGLFLLERFIQQRNGWLQIISRKGFYEKNFESGITIEKEELESGFPGTIVSFCIEYKADDTQFVQLTEEESIDSMIQNLFRRDIYDENN